MRLLGTHVGVLAPQPDLRIFHNWLTVHDAGNRRMAGIASESRLAGKAVPVPGVRQSLALVGAPFLTYDARRWANRHPSIGTFAPLSTPSWSVWTQRAPGGR